MLISYNKEFIFIHIYKTAGSSIRALFIPESRFIDRLCYEFKISRYLIHQIVDIMGWHDDGLKQFTGFHRHVKAVDVKEKLGAEKFNSYYKFAFIRNPFDLLVSLYEYIRGSKVHRYHEKVKGMSFKEFLQWHIENDPPRQIDFVINKQNDLLVDFIGKFESLEEDVSTVIETLNLDVNKSLKHKNPSKKRQNKDYKNYYDQESRRLVENYFDQDLELGSYSF